MRPVLPSSSNIYPLSRITMAVKFNTDDRERNVLRFLAVVAPGRRTFYTLLVAASFVAMLFMYAVSESSFARVRANMSTGYFLLTLLSLFRLLTTRHDRWHTEYRTPVPNAEEFANAVADMWRPFVHDLDDYNYTTRWGRNYSIEQSSHRWDAPLGKDVLILDVDTRLDDPGSSSVLLGGNLTPRRAGRLNHYIYSLIHGYDYRLIHAPRYWMRHQTWVKVPMMQMMLQQYRFVVFLDSDAVFVEPRVPLEWLMNLWDIRDDTITAMPIDLDEPNNYDDRDRRMLNTGFVIAQQTPKTEEMFDAWVNCPTEEQFPGCNHWSFKWAHEQAAFAYYIRYAYNESHVLREIPANDANGSPYIEQNATCGGAFVSHYWLSKPRAIDDLHRLVSDGMALQRNEGIERAVFDAFAKKHPVHA